MSDYLVPSLERNKVLGEHIRWVLSPFDKEELNLAILYHIPNVVVAQVNMFTALFLDRVRGNKNRALVIPK